MDRRRAILRLAPDAILSLLKDSKYGCRLKISERGLPADATFLGCVQSAEYDCFMVAVQSEEFEEIAPCMMLPMLDDPVIETTSHPSEMEALLTMLINEIMEHTLFQGVDGEWAQAADLAIEKLRQERKGSKS